MFNCPGCNAAPGEIHFASCPVLNAKRILVSERGITFVADDPSDADLPEIVDAPPSHPPRQ